jgi:uncharacterized protein YbcI
MPEQPNPDRVDARDAGELISEELLTIHRESYGVGAASAKTYVMNDLVVCVMEGLDLLPNEQFLADNGRGDSVVDLRREYQQVISASFCAAVERATGRRVTHFLSDTRLDEQAFCIEVFRLASE